MSRDVDVLIRFGADGRIRIFPIVDVAADSARLAERLHRLCHRLIESPDTLRRLVGTLEEAA